MITGSTLAAFAASTPRRTSLNWADPLLLGGALFAALMMLADRLLGDPDTQWHIAIGARIWREGAVPWIDQHSHTFAGAPWIAKEWLSQLILSGAYSLAGWSGVTILTAAVLAAVFALLFGWLERRLRAMVALAATLLAIMFVAPHFLVRPHVFALATLLGWTIGLANALERGRAPPWRLLPLLVLWANLHGSFTVAYPLAGLFAAEAVLFAPAGQKLTTAARWALFGALALAAGCATPYGIQSMAVTATLFGSAEPLPFLIEWQPLALDAGGLLALGSMALLLAGLAVEPRRNAFRILGIAGLTAMTLRHGRFLDVLALAAPVLAAGPIARCWPGLGPERSEGPSRGLHQRRLPLAAIGAVALGLMLSRSPEPDPVMTPVAALEAARRAGVSGPVFNDYDFGGFLIRQGVPTFIDGRTDQLFLGGFISSLYRVVRTEADGPFLDLLARYGVTWALVKPDSPEAQHLERALGWRRVYRDRVAALYLRG